MEGIPDRRGERIFTDRPQSTVLAASKGLIARKRGGFPRGSDRGVRGTRVPEVCGRSDAARQPVTAHRSGSGVLNRLVPRSPSFQGASLGRRGEAQASKRCRERDVARVLVVESSGKQRSVERIRLVLPRPVARQAAGRRASPSQTARSADAEGGSSSPDKMNREGRRKSRAARLVALAAEALG